tara:strand:- start:7360 stop:8373 length:1014 start_codon:yes stop_codon:yes gene_type:complete
MNIYLIIPFIFISIIFYFFFDKIEKFFNLKDHPDGKRKFQSVPVPLLGGIILFINFIIYLLLNAYNNTVFSFDYVTNSREVFSLIFGSIIFFLFGLYDDKFKLSANYKLIISFFLVLFFVMVDNNLLITELHFSFINNSIELKNFSYFFSVLAILLFMNALNMFDGINLQSGTYILIIFLIFLLKDISFNLILSLIFPLIIFLILNYKNKAYLGESGIQFTAFIISYMFIKSNNYENLTFYADEIFIIMGLPGLDMFRLFITRLLSGKHPFKGDANHIHHLFSNYFSKNISFIIILIYILISIFIYLNIENKLIYIILYILAYIAMITFLIKFKKKN